MTQETIIVWFRQDLRLADNPALSAAHETGAKILPVYILDDENAGERKMGAASRVWLHHSLSSLNDDLKGHLVFLKGDALKLLPELAHKTNASAVYWNRCYEPWRIARDKKIEKAFGEKDMAAETFSGCLLWEPDETVKDDGTPYKVFTAFYKNLLKKPEPRQPLPAPKNMAFATHKGQSLDSLSLLPSKPEPRWDEDMAGKWKIGEKHALKALDDFLDDGLNGYKKNRDFPAMDSTSHLSPRLHFGEISPYQVWHASKIKGHQNHAGHDTDHYLRELIWREFNYSLVAFFPKMEDRNFQPRFDSFPWDKNAKTLKAWQKGQTGYPIVDAAMRELWQTGYMHNRCRLIAGSFFCKHLLLYWPDGEQWFWDCLFDADNANNVCNWQWIAGTGADAAPYFRIFNPVMQGEKFDKKGDYVRKYVPELKNLPDKYIHKPWDAPPDILKRAGVTLGKTYPAPIVDHATARDRALAAFAKTKT